MALKLLGTAVAGLIALTGSAPTSTALAQNYPTRPITMVIPFAAGGPTDVLGRVMAAKMSDPLGQQVVVENVTGAGGQTGSKRVADAPPDGYNILIGMVGTHAGDMIGEIALAIEMGADAVDIGKTIHPHPTLSETLMEAAEAFIGQATHMYRPPR